MFFATILIFFTFVATATPECECLFPFIYKESEHYECITYDNDGTPWCVIDDDGNMANCMSDCPGKLS